jgi:hypothetical protein
MKTRQARTKVVVSLLALVVLLGLSPFAMAEDPVYFADANLKAAVESHLGISDPTPTDMLSLTSLTAVSRGIVDLTGIEYATNLTYLRLHDNQISDISPLSGLTNLRELFLQYNQISDISALSGLTNLTLLFLQYNPLNVCAYCFYLPLIEANNPGIRLTYDPNPYPPEACDLYPCCGDGRIQWRQGETCEPPDSHIFGSWHCDTECQAYYEPGDCGDGIVQWRRGERCEIGVGNECGPRAECIDCVCESTAYCGDGIVQWRRGERCDPPSSICGSRGNPDWVCSDTCECEFVGGN